MSKKPQSGPFIQRNQGRFSRHQIKKPKKSNQEKDNKQLLQYIEKNQDQPLISIYETLKADMPGHYKLGIWLKNLSLLTRSHLPLYVKLLEQTEGLNLVPSKANINPKKNTKTDILIQDSITQKTRLIKMDSFSILLSPQEVIFYQLNLNEFEQIFQGLQINKEDLRRIFNYYTEQNQSGQKNDIIFWPAVIFQGLFYKVQDILELLVNCTIVKEQNRSLFEHLIKIVNDSQINLSNSVSIGSHGNKQAQGGSLQEQNTHKLQMQIENNQQPQNIGEIPKEEQIIKQNNRQQIQQNDNQVVTQKSFFVWLIGTAHFKFTNKNIVCWHSLSNDTVKSIFSSTLFSGFLKETNQIIDSLNKHVKLKRAQLKADDYKNFLYRLGFYKGENETEELCIPLRFQYIKGVGKKILIRILKQQSTQLKWVPTESTVVNYTLPNLTKKQMCLMYLVKKMKPLDIIVNLFYREYLLLPECNITQIFVSHYPQFHVTQKDAHYQRCKDCNFIIRAMPFRCCFFCKTFCHQQCVVQSHRKASIPFLSQIFSQEQPLPWICQKCQSCTVCSQAVGDDFLFCSVCFSYSHFQCGRIKGLQQNESKMNHLKINDKYVCEFCLKCKMCSHKLKDCEYLLIDSQFYCSQCSEKIKTNNHCSACMKKKEGGNSSVKWIQCGSELCLKWIHQSCDKQYLLQVKSPTQNDPYLCPFCRDVEKRKVYAQIIDCIAVFDQAQFFTEPSYLQIPIYSTIISEPMCFQVMKQKAHQGKYDDDPIRKINADFQLIISNALKFNMPKDPAHVQAKILKILGQKTLQKYEPLFKHNIKALIEGKTFQQIKRVNLQLHRQINNHYLQILLNYKAEKSFVEVRQSKRKPNEYKLEDQLKFRSAQILNNLFKNSTIIFHLKKQRVKIGNLFTMPKSENQIGAWQSIKGDICYYHNGKDIIFTCNQCGQSYCCMRQCIRHRYCLSCGQKGCKCDNFECECPPIKQKQKKKVLQKKLLNKYGDPFKSEKDNLMDISQMYKYCLKCVQDKIISRTCAACDGLCCWGYFKCPDCTKVWHKQCYPQFLQVSYVSNSTLQTISRPQQYHSDQASITSNTITNRSLNYIHKLNPTPTCSINYCNQCLSNYHANNYQQALILQSKSKLVKISKITRYMRIFIQVYFNEGVRLTPYEIQQLILQNYDQFSIREQLFKEYQLNYSIIERFRDFIFKTNAAIERSCNQYVNDYAQVKKSILMSASSGSDVMGWRDNLEYLNRARNIWMKYFNCWGCTQQLNRVQNTYSVQPCPLSECAHWRNRFYLQTILQARQKIISQAYVYKDYNSHQYQTYKATSNIVQFLESHTKNTNQSHKMEQQISNQSFYSVKQYRNYLRSLNYIPTHTQSFYKSQHRYRFTLLYHPRAMPFQYKLNPTFKKKSNLQQATKQFLLGIYQQSKFCLRKGTTCILKYSNGNKDTKDYWCVLKRWGKGKKQMQITLQKKIGLWFLKIDNKHQKIVHQIQQIINQINRYHSEWKITSFKQLGEFLGFTIYQPLYKANHFTTFLQTNLVDEMPLMDKMNKIKQLYDSFSWGENGIFLKMAPASLAQNTPTEPISNGKVIPYQYSITKNKPQYLVKKPRKVPLKSTKKIQRRLSGFNGIQLQTSQNYANSLIDNSVKKHPFITFEDLKRYLSDYAYIPNPIKSQISLRNNPILNEVFIAPSKIHKLGLFSRKNIKKNSIVIQYIGQIVSESIADLRQKKFHYGCYLFSILKQNFKQNQDKKDIIDATFRGNMARYLNHSCDPNCKARTQYVNGSPRIIIYTIRDIQQFEQITYDYQFNVDAVQKLECTCKAKNCQGRLN